MTSEQIISKNRNQYWERDNKIMFTTSLKKSLMKKLK